MDETVLISKKKAEKASSVPITHAECTEIDRYEAECCWKVTEMGFERFPSGDSAHGESQTRIIHSIGEVTRVRLSNAGKSFADCRVLVRTCQPEAPLVAAVSQLEEDMNIVYQLEEPVVDVKAIRRAFIAARIRAEDVILLYAMSGCSLTASMHHIPQQLFVDAFFGSDGALSELYCPQVLSLPPSESEPWLKFHRLVATAYLLKYSGSDAQGAPGTSDRTPRMGIAVDGTLPPSPFSEGHEWLPAMRKWVAEHGDVMAPCQLMPEPCDVELQARRAVWVLKYWQSSSNYGCNRNTVGGNIEDFGYTEKGNVLFERPEEVLKREDIMKKVVQTCGCKTGCNNARCSCRKRGSRCVICDCWKNASCKNRPALRAEDLASLNIAEPDSEDSEEEVELSEDEESSDDDSIFDFT